jgi:hypothetical protein
VSFRHHERRGWRRAGGGHPWRRSVRRLACTRGNCQKA